MGYELIIIGGGPAGVAAGVYAARKRLKTLFITPEWGGQSIVSAEIQNWIGTKAISGDELARNLKEHLLTYRGESLEILEGEKVSQVLKSRDGYKVTTERGKEFETAAILVATGSSRRKLEVPGADRYEQKGLTYCATCDGPLFADQDVAVIGGGNAGFETAGQLVAYAKSVTLLHHGAEFKADPITVEKLAANPRMRALRNSETVEVKGDQFVTHLVYKDLESGETNELPVTGIFVEIGHIPATYFVKDLVKMNKYGAIEVDPRTQQTSASGIWAAGDCTDTLYHQNNIAAGDAVRALEDIYVNLRLK